MITLGSLCEPKQLVREVPQDKKREAGSIVTAPDDRHPFTNLQELSADRSLDTGEIFDANDFYGHAAILKHYAGLPPDYALKTSIEHGLFFGDFVWEVELDCPLPAMLVTSPLRYPVLRERTPKALFAIGPVILYAANALSVEALESERRRLGRTLLAMPSHSTHHLTVEFDAENYCELLKKMGREFDRVRVCLYWKDVLLGRAEVYRRYGFECVTAGHMFDPQFLPRLRSIIELSTVTTSNICGSHIGYCAAMGKPHVLAGLEREQVHLENDATVKRDFNQAQYADPNFIRIQEAFSHPTDELLPEQKQLATRCWGLDEKKSPAELRLILRIAEEMYRRRNTTLRYHSNVMKGQAELAARLGRSDVAQYLEEQLRAVERTTKA